mgnify:FL=1
METLSQAVLFLGTAGVVVPLFKRLNVSPTLGFLIAGILLGPFVMGQIAALLPLLRPLAISSGEEIAHIGEFGVVFLFFMIGLELSLDRVRMMRRLIFGLGAAQFLLSTLLIGAIAWLMGQQLVASLVIGAALAMSSTAVVVPTLAERKRLGTTSGRASFAVLLFQDLAVTPLLVMVTLLASAKGGGASGAALWTLVQAGIGMVVLIFAGRVLLRPLFHSVAMAGSQEFFMAACLLVVIGAGLAAHVAGLSMAIGAFIGGLLLAETEFRRQIEATIDPFRGLLLGLFFIAIGARLDLSLLADAPVQIILITLLLVISKAFVLYLVMPRFGIAPRARHEIAWLLAPAGEFGIVLISEALDVGLLWPALGGKLLVAVTLSMFLIPVFAMAIDRAIAASGRGPAPFDTLEQTETAARVVIIGCGRVGTLVWEMLARHNVPALVIDANQRNVALARDEGLKVYYGDPSMPQFFDRLPLSNARALVLTLSDPSATEQILRQARARFPTLTIVARSRDPLHAQRLYDIGVTDAVPETFEASLQLAEAVLVDIGIPMGLVIASVHDKRDQQRARLKSAGHEVREPGAVRRLKPES